MLYITLISLSSNQPKKLWASLDSLLSLKTSPSLPTSPSPSLLATSFLNFFGDKIVKLRSTLDSFSASLTSPHLPSPCPPPSLSTFAPATIDEVRAAILSSSDATCSLDLIPTRLLKSCLDSFLLPITTLINLSISESIFPDEFKSAIVTPLHKKHSLPIEDLSSYRPISNLNFISKIFERIIHNRLNRHLTSFPSLSPLQFAYRKFHSAETALLRIYNDLLVSISQRKLSALVLLDLSAAFDTIDHNSLLSRLTSNFGISGSALHLIFPIALSLFPFNLTSLLLLPSPLASLRVQSLVLFSSVYTLRLSLTFFQTPLFRITFMLMILNSTSPSLLQILLLFFPSFLLLLILSLIGLLQIASLSIPQKLNFFLLALLNSVPS